MPSPFPGMDPYLENREIFPDLHGGFITYLKETLQAILPEPYYASENRRTWIDVSDRPIEPDVNVVRSRGVDGTADGPKESATAVQTVVEPVVIPVPDEEWSEPYLEIYTGRRPHRRLVASIEVLSPSNKRAGNKGRREYRKKQIELLEAQVHLVEIDLLRSGKHTTAVPPRRLRRKVPKYDYHVCVRAFHRRSEFLAFPFLLEQSLPVVEVPLLPGDGGVEVNLQAVFNHAYDAGPYRREIDYANQLPDPPLNEDQMNWAREQIAQWRSATPGN